MFHLAFPRQRAQDPGTIPVDGVVRIGRAADCELRLDDASVSRRHAMVSIEKSVDGAPPRLIVRDEGSANGTFVNGVRVDAETEQFARSGDTLRFGLLEALLVWKNTDVAAVPAASGPSSVDLGDLFSVSASRARWLEEMTRADVASEDDLLKKAGDLITRSVRAGSIVFGLVRPGEELVFRAWGRSGLCDSSDRRVVSSLVRCARTGEMQLVETSAFNDPGEGEFEISVCIPMSAEPGGPGALFVSPESGSGYTTGELEFLVLVSQAVGRQLATWSAEARAMEESAEESEQTLCLDEPFDPDWELSREKSLADERVRALIRARDAADASNRSKTEFLANVSHELRTPLHAILSFADLGIERFEAAPREKLKAYFGRISESGRELLRIVNDLLDLSQLEAGNLKLSLEKVEVNELISEVIAELEPIAQSCGLDVSWSSPAPVVAIVDPARIKQAVRNLVGNAVRFSPRGGRVEVRLESLSGHFNFSVADQGPGIPEDELESIFEKFVQSSRTRTGSGGTGLGLAISSRFVLGHRGRIWAANRKSGGSVFRFSVPLEPRSIRARSPTAPIEAPDELLGYSASHEEKVCHVRES